MRPIAVFRHVACEGPGYLHDVLGRHHVNYELIAIDNGDPIPKTPESYSALVFLGGPMSVNDPLTWVSQELDLIRVAHASGVPMLGICLGAQLIAKALGATVRKNEFQEIGWFPVSHAPNTQNQAWLHDIPPSFPAFHWHGETFDVPEAAVYLWRSAACKNQGFAIGSTLALQFHVEVTEEMIDLWTSEHAQELSDTQTWVQSREAIRRHTSTYLPPLRHTAERLFARWLQPISEIRTKEQVRNNPPN